MQVKRNILLNPGPATTTDAVKMAQVVSDICPRENEFASMMKQMRDDLVRIVHGNLDKYTSVLFCGSGTITMDVCINSLLPEGKKMLVTNNRGGRIMKKIPLATPTMHTGEQQYIQKAFETNWISPLGPNVDEFENKVAAYVGASSSAALSSGTAALHLSVILAGVKENDIVFVPSLTFAASVNPVRYEMATPVFIDSERDTWNMDVAALRKAFEKYPNPKAVMAVHLYGTSANMDEICALCKEHNVPLIEDAAESLGTTYKGKMTGTFGDYGIYSFNGNKIITTSGGGILVAKQEKDVDKARFLSRQARDPARHYQHSTIGYNYRMSNVVAGIGCGQMQHIEEHIQKKHEIYKTYKEAFLDIEEIEMNPLNKAAVDNNWLSCMTISADSRVTPTQVMDALEVEGIETRPIWKPMHLQPVFKEYDFIQVEDGISVSEDIFNRGLCLPSDIKNTKEDMERIIKIVRKQFRQQQNCRCGRIEV